MLCINIFIGEYVFHNTGLYLEKALGRNSETACITVDKCLTRRTRFVSNRRKTRSSISRNLLLPRVVCPGAIYRNRQLGTYVHPYDVLAGAGYRSQTK